MKLIELMHPPAEEGGVVNKTVVNAAKSAFCYKKALEPVFLVALGGDVSPCIGTFETVAQEFVAAGYVKFDAPEGGEAYVNPDQILLYAMVELGIYRLVFDGKIALTVKATGVEIEDMFSEGPNQDPQPCVPNKSNIVID